MLPPVLNDQGRRRWRSVGEVMFWIKSVVLYRTMRACCFGCFRRGLYAILLPPSRLCRLSFQSGVIYQVYSHQQVQVMLQYGAFTQSAGGM